MDDFQTCKHYGNKAVRSHDVSVFHTTRLVVSRQDPDSLAHEVRSQPFRFLKRTGSVMEDATLL